MADPVRYGPTRIVFSGDERRAKEYLPAAMQWLRITQERQRLGGTDILRYVRELAEDAYCQVILGGGMSTLRIVAGPATVEGGMIAKDIIPDFVSGVVRGGILEPRQMFGRDVEGSMALHTFHATTETFWRYFREKPSVEPAYAPIDRLAVAPHGSIAGRVKNPDQNSDVEFSQYARLKPTMYSGRMRRCVQVLMGFGRQRRKPPEMVQEISVYDDLPTTSLTGTAAGHAQATREAGLQVAYDWAWIRTHGVATATDGKLWLVEISKMRGIIAMPLPVHPDTTTDEFRAGLGDYNREAEQVLDEFGGFPTGEGFPEKIEAWIDAGRVIRLAEPEALTAFYEHQMYSPDIGWAFNLRGTEAHNTAWRFGDDGCQRGVHYACLLEIGATRDYTPAAGLAAKMTGMDEPPDDLEAVQWKCGLLTETDRNNAEAYSGLELYEFVKGRTVQPLAPGNAGCNKVSEGFMWEHAKVRVPRNNCFKFPFLPLDYLMTHDMRAMDEHVPQPDVCDTTMFVFFKGNDLCWVKFFRDKRELDYRNEDNFEPCMYVGEWEKYEGTGQTTIPMMFYTNDFDHREELTTREKHTKINSVDLGYHRCVVSDGVMGVYGHAGYVTRRKRFQKMTDVREWTGRRLRTGVAVPIGEREGYYYARAERVERYTHAIRHTYEYQEDPYRYYHWRNRSHNNVDEWMWAWCESPTGGCCWSEGDEEGNCGYGATDGTWTRLELHPTGFGPTLTRTVITPGVPFVLHSLMPGFAKTWFDGTVYFPGPCDEADEGPWLFGGEWATPLAYEIPAPPLPGPFDLEEGGNEFYDVWLVTSSEHGPIHTVEEKPITQFDDGFMGWEIFSPNPDPPFEGRIYETHNAFGEGNTIKYSKDMNDGPTEIKGLPAWVGIDIGDATFIGAVNRE